VFVGAFLGWLVIRVTPYIDEVLSNLYHPDEVRCDVISAGQRKERAPDSRFTVLLSALDGDNDKGLHTGHVLHALKGIEVFGTCEVFKIDSLGLHSKVTGETLKKGQAWLQEKNADLLIWGEADEVNRTLTLWFLNREGATTYRDNTRVHPLQTVLPTSFNEDFNAQLYAIAVASIQPVSQELGSYLVDRLKPIVEKLNNLRNNFPPYFTREQQGGIHLASGFAALIIGDQTGERNSTLAAIDSYKDALKALSLDHDPDGWIAAQVGLGEALAKLDRQQVEPQNSHDALAAFDAALNAPDLDKLTQAWIQVDRGDVLATRGHRETGKGWLDLALAAYQAALWEPGLQQDQPVLWASAQAGRLSVLLELADRGVGSTNLNDVIKESKDALKALEDKNVPFIQAPLQRSLAMALTTFGRRQGSQAALIEAAALLFEVMSVLRLDNTPYEWALTQLGWGYLCESFSDFDTRAEWYGKANKAYQEALGVLNRNEYPLLWAITTGARGSVLHRMGELENEVERMWEAKRLLVSALDVLRPDHVPLLWATNQTQLAAVLTGLAEQGSTSDELKTAGEALTNAQKIIESTGDAHWLWNTRRIVDTAKLQQAVAAAKGSLTKLSKKETPLEWARAKHQLGDALATLGATFAKDDQTQSGIQRFSEAIAAYQDALEARTQDEARLDWAETKHRLGDANANLGMVYWDSRQWDFVTKYLGNAVDAYREARKELPRRARPSEWASTHGDLDDYDRFLTIPLDPFSEQYLGLKNYSGLKRIVTPKDPINYMTAQHNLGDALFFSGRLVDAIEAYQKVLEERSYEKKAFEWALVQYNLSVAQEIRVSPKESVWCEALKNHVDVLKFLAHNSGYVVFAGAVLKSFDTSSEYIALWRPRAEVSGSFECMRNLKPSVTEIRRGLQHHESSIGKQEAREQGSLRQKGQEP